MTNIKSACVYCGSSKGLDEKYQSAARDLGKALAKNNIKMVYGGGKTGLMGATATACMNAGGYVMGIVTEYLDQFEGGHDSISELHRVKTMHERKLKMFRNSDAFIAMPGGLGTLDETFEVLTWRQIGLHKKCVVFLNIDGYWDKLFELIDSMISQGFMREVDKNIFKIANNVDEIINLLTCPTEENDLSEEDFVSKWV